MGNWLKIGVLWLSSWLVTVVISSVLYSEFATLANIGLIDFLVTLLLIIGTSGFLTLLGVLLYDDDQRKGTVAVGILAVLSISLLFLGSALISGGVLSGSESSESPAAGPPYSGTVASEAPSKNQTTSHTLTLKSGEQMKITLQGRGYWSIQSPGRQNPISGRVPTERDFSASPNLTSNDGTFYYTANQTGTHKITVSAEVYESVGYRISIQNTTG